MLGMRLANPVLVASGPLSESLAQIQRALAAGAGGVVTKTIYAGEKEAFKERIVRSAAGAFNSTTYSRLGLEEWLLILSTLAEKAAPVVASIYARQPEQLGRLAKQVVDAGAPALELGLSCPVDESQKAADWRLVGSFTRAVRKTVDVPFSVKLTAGGGLPENVKAAVGQGADAISLSDAVPALVVDIEHRSLPLGHGVGYSGPAIKPIVLHAIYELRQAGFTCPIIGIGGIESAADVVEYLQVGASAVQLYTALMTRKMPLLRSITADLSVWCRRHGVGVPELVGAALPRGSR